jgi:Phospholipase_D-nuclease N-terminal
MGGTIFTAALIIWFVSFIWAIIMVIKSSLPTHGKFLWSAAILFLPILGGLLYLFFTYYIKWNGKDVTDYLKNGVGQISNKERENQPQSPTVEIRDDTPPIQKSIPIKEVKHEEKAYPEKVKNGYATDGQDLNAISEKESKKRLGKASWRCENLMVMRYNSGLKVADDLYINERAVKDINEVTADLSLNKTQLILNLYTGHFDKSYLFFGFSTDEIEQIALTLNVKELDGDQPLQISPKALISGVLTKITTGSGALAGSAVRRISKRGASSNERVNTMAIHTKIEGKENVIVLCFKYSNFEEIEDFCRSHFGDKLIVVKE